jgi:hypothetical protein
LERLFAIASGQFFRAHLRGDPVRDPGRLRPERGDQAPHDRSEQLAGRALAVVEGLGMGERRRRKASVPYANI